MVLPRIFPPTLTEHKYPLKQDRRTLEISAHSDLRTGSNAKIISGFRNCGVNGQSHFNVNYVHDTKLLASYALHHSNCHCPVNPFYVWTPDSPTEFFGNAAMLQNLKRNRVSETDTNSSDSGFKCGIAPRSNNQLCTDVSAFIGVECLRKPPHVGERQ